MDIIIDLLLKHSVIELYSVLWTVCFMDQAISTVSSTAGDARKLYSITSFFSLFVSLLICLHYIAFWLSSALL